MKLDAVSNIEQHQSTCTHSKALDIIENKLDENEESIKAHKATPFNYAEFCDSHGRVH
jgi:hypothetical protein